MRKYTTLFLLALVFVISSCSGGTLTIKDAWVRPSLAGNNSAIYFIIDNPGGADTLLSAATDTAATVEMHMTMAVEGEPNTDHEMEGMPQGEVMRMVQQETVPVPARTDVIFEPGGLHIMLIGLNSDLVTGDSIELTLSFENAGTMTVKVPVMEK